MADKFIRLELGEGNPEFGTLKLKHIDLPLDQALGIIDESMVIVPIEPTEEMLSKGFAILDEKHDSLVLDWLLTINEDDLKKAYKAMITPASQD